MENSENDEPEGRVAYDIWTHVENSLVGGPIGALFLYVSGLMRNDPEFFQIAAWMWNGLAVLLPPFIVWRIGLRRPPGDKWRAGAILSYGALPCLLLIAPGAWSSTPVGLQFALPTVVMWTIACQWVAMRRTPPPETLRARALVLGGGAIICGLIALVFFGGAGFGLFMSLLASPDAPFIGVAIVIICLLPAIVMIYASGKMFSEAARAWRAA